MLTRDNLYAYQKRAVEFIKSKEACALWIDMGLGKTAATLTAVSDLIERFDAEHVLVVAPLRVARKVWRDEILSWAHLSHLSISRATGTEAQRIAALKRKANIHTINRENLPWLERMFIQDKKQIRKWPWDTVILDESHSFMDQGAQRWKSMDRLRNPKLNAPIHRLIQLTGTPLPRRYASIWAQLKLLDRGRRLGTSEDWYTQRYFDTEFHDSYTTQTIKDGAAEEIQGLVSDIVLTVLDEEKHPRPVKNFVRIDLPGPIMKKYKELQRKTIAEFGGRKIKAQNAGVLWGKLLQLANGAVYYDREGNWLHLHDEKIDGLYETLEGISGQCMIPYGFKHDRARLEKALEKFCGKRRVWRSLKTEADEDAWNRGEIDYLLLHPASAGEGSNLHKCACEDILWFGLTPNPVHYRQLNGRLFGGHRRAGKNGRIHHLIAEGTIDEDAVELLDDKIETESGMMRALSRLSG